MTWTCAFLLALSIFSFVPRTSFAEEGWQRHARAVSRYRSIRTRALRSPPPRRIALFQSETTVISSEFIRVNASALKDMNTWLTRYDSRTIGEMIVQRLHVRTELKPEKACAKCLPYDKIRDSQVVLQFHRSDFAAIIQHGFLNSHQIEKSGGEYDSTARISAESGLLSYAIGDPEELPGADGYDVTYKMKPSDPVNVILPKYAYLELTTDVPFESSKPYKEYGEVFAVMKPEVKRRVTWSVGDSVETSDIDLKPAYSLLGKKLPDSTVGERYLEAQIWGEVDLRDVDYFMIPEGSLAKNAALKTAGIPIYEFKLETLGSHIAAPFGRDTRFSRKVHTRTKLVYRGNPSVLAENRRSLAQSRRAPDVKILKELKSMHPARKTDCTELMQNASL